MCFVGSSSISRAALGDGIEWNLRIDRDGDPPSWDRAVAAFDELWSSARVLDEAWVQAYSARAVAHVRRRAPSSRPARKTASPSPPAPASRSPA